MHLPRRELAAPRVVGTVQPGRAVADDDQFATGAGESDIHAASVGEEADFSVGVRPHTGDHDRFLLAALEAVDCVDLQPARVRVRAQPANLSGVRSDDGNVLSGQAGVTQLTDFLQD